MAVLHCEHPVTNPIDPPANSCALTLQLDKALVALFRWLVNDNHADLCSALSSRRQPVQYHAQSVDGCYEVSLIPDSPQQRVWVNLRQGDVYYTFSRSFGQFAPYGGHYDGVKQYPELGAVAISDQQVEALLQQWLGYFEQKPMQWHRQVRANV